MNFINVEKTKELKNVCNKIKYYKRTMVITVCPIKKQWLEVQLIKEISYAANLIDELNKNICGLSKKDMNRQNAEITSKELSTFDGMEGRPAYVAVNGIIYDVSNEATWGGASHFGLMAGKDLTPQFNSCHGMIGILSKLPKVGVLK